MSVLNFKVHSPSEIAGRTKTPSQSEGGADDLARGGREAPKRVSFRRGPYRAVKPRYQRGRHPESNRGTSTGMG